MRAFARRVSSSAYAAPADWSLSDAVADLRQLARSSERVYDKHIGYDGYDELAQWLSAAAGAFDAGDLEAASFYVVGAIKQMGYATTNIHIDWAKLGLEAF